MTRRLLQVAMLITLAACRSTQATSPSAQAAADPGWQLSFHLSGGFAGMDRRLELASTGLLTASDRRRGTDVAARAASADLNRITTLLADLKANASPGRSACRDCLEYDVEVRMRGRSLVLHLQDTMLASSGTEPLIRILTQLLDDAFAGRLTAVQPAPG